MNDQNILLTKVCNMCHKEKPRCEFEVGYHGHLVCKLYKTCRRCREESRINEADKRSIEQLKRYFGLVSPDSKPPHYPLTMKEAEQERDRQVAAERALKPRSKWCW